MYSILVEVDAMWKRITRLSLLFTCASVILTPTFPAEATTGFEPKSNATALWYSHLSTFVPAVVGGVLIIHGQSRDFPDEPSDAETAAGITIGSLGLIFGPGAGHAYAGNRGRFWKGGFIRVGVVSLGMFGAVAIASGTFQGPFGGGGNDAGLIAMGIFIAGVGVGLCCYSAVKDFGTLDDSVRKYNDRHKNISLALSPLYFPEHKAIGAVFTVTW
jgi:hypothetical protein